MTKRTIHRRSLMGQFGEDDHWKRCHRHYEDASSEAAGPTRPTPPVQKTTTKTTMKNQTFRVVLKQKKQQTERPKDRQNGCRLRDVEEETGSGVSKRRARAAPEPPPLLQAREETSIWRPPQLFVTVAPEGPTYLVRVPLTLDGLFAVTAEALSISVDKILHFTYGSPSGSHVFSDEFMERMSLFVFLKEDSDKPGGIQKDEWRERVISSPSVRRS